MLRNVFANPWAFSLLSLMPILSLLGFFALRRRRRALEQLGTLLTLDVLIAPRRWTRFLSGFAFSLAMTLLVLGIAGPQWGRDYSQSVAPGRDLVVLLDVSRSMLAEQPSRLQRAQTALVDLATALEQRGGHRLGLVIFAGRARVACPLTHDYHHFREVVENLDGDRLASLLASDDEGESGTRIGLGIREAVAQLDARHRGYQDVLLLSDGDDPARDGEWRLPAAEARRDGVPVHVVGLGDPERRSPIPLGVERWLTHEGKQVTTRLEEAPLQEIADITEGIYTPAHTKALPLGKLFRETIEPRPAREGDVDALPVVEQRYPWFLGGALALLALLMTFEGRTRSHPATVAPRPDEEEES